ncbi:unnamed protein product [Eruca vesicaria subsp. sativa]|uniref:Uncharacterized protein n=1 Tax=Eruca vesicaria subsp. sativa TaxID=29727 RepID=A0ABC8K4C5_ERUVS|nr:unnamed protein product [Eruca vesicaria subsp. sativa]
MAKDQYVNKDLFSLILSHVSRFGWSVVDTRQVRHLKDQGFQCDEKVVKVQKTVCELKKTVRELKTVCVVVSVLASIGLAVMCVTGRASMV